MFRKLQLALVISIFAASGITHHIQAQVSQNVGMAVFMTGYLGYRFKDKIMNWANGTPALVVAAVKDKPEIPMAFTMEYAQWLISSLPWSVILMVYGFNSAYGKCKDPRNTVWDYIKPHMGTIYCSMAGATALYIVDTVSGYCPCSSAAKVVAPLGTAAAAVATTVTK